MRRTHLIPESNDALFTSENRISERFNKPSASTSSQAVAHSSREEAPQKTGIDDFNASDNSTGRSLTEWPLDSLIEYVINAHHRPVKQNAAGIYKLAQKVAYRHGESHPKLSRLVTMLFLFLDDFLYHIKHEEQILFRNITQLIRNQNSERKFPYANFGSIRRSAESMKKEHLALIAEINVFGELTDNFTPPATACHWHTDLYAQLKKFTNDVRLHIILENDVLFPRAILLEQKHGKKQETDI